MDLKTLVAKYDVPVPRYTSYPTVPVWRTENFNPEDWKEAVRQRFVSNKEGVSLYIHLPYCESLCTYCGCNTRITVNHEVELPYIQAVLKEWHLYLSLFSERPLIREIHLGGGTPTFFSPEHLQYLIESIIATADVHPDHDFGFEGHPNNTTKAHLEVLYSMGFRRVSFGIQDFDEKVQKAIHRIQPYENVARVTRWAREAGYESVNFDLIYGLPFQTSAGVERTMNRVKTLSPDRIAFYSYAHVPWVKPGQRAYNETDLPQGDEKRQLNALGQQLLEEMGYQSIGMDHFAKPGDGLVKAAKEGNLHRNFMGYTVSNTDFLIGLGVSSISDIGIAYGQNVKTVEGYVEKIEKNNIPVFKGHMLTTEEKRVKSRILQIACTRVIPTEAVIELDRSRKERFDEMLEEGLVVRQCVDYMVSPLGLQFLRNICALFDEHYRPEEKVYSQAV